ncbi:MAG: class F sortase [Candidatus Saccharimonadales bacterium]
MSRRERISDFQTRSGRVNTRPVSRRQYSGTSGGPSIDFEPSVRGASPVKIIRDNVKRTSPKTHPVQPKQTKSYVLRRNGLKKLPTFKPQKPSRRRVLVKYGAALVVMFLIVISPFLLYKNFHSKTDGVVMGVKKLIDSSYSNPRYLIASGMMDVPAKIEIVGSIDNYNRALQDTNKLGWYEKSSKPGEDGVMVFVGYVSGEGNTGALREIKALKSEDFIQIETGDGRILRFKVKNISTRDTNETNFDDLLKPTNDQDKEAINIITYSDIDGSDKELAAKRYVVYAVKE